LAAIERAKWKVQSIGEVTTNVVGRVSLSDLTSEEQIAHLTLGSLESGTGRAVIRERAPLKTTATKVTRFNSGDVLLGRLRPFSGKVWLADSKGLCTTDIIVLKPSNSIVPAFLAFFLRSTHFKDAVDGVMRATTNSRISYAQLSECKMAVPPMKEQEEVVTLLTTADGLRRRRQQSVENLDSLLLSSFLRMFGDPTTNPKRWPTAKLGELLDAEMGRSPRCLERRARDGEFGVLKTSAVTTGIFRPIENKALKPDVKPKKHLGLSAGDLLFTRANSPELVGTTAVVTDSHPQLLLSDKLWRLSPKSATNVAFLKLFLSLPPTRRQLREISRGALPSMSNVRKEYFLSLRVFVPPKVLQERFSLIFEPLMSQSLKARTQADEFEILFRSLSARLFKSDTYVERSVGDSPELATPISHDRRIWQHLSSRQRLMWDLVLRFDEPFGLSELGRHKEMAGVRGSNREKLLSTLDLLVSLGVIIRESRDGVELWRRPNADSDSEVEV
jgi:type I restriction enzyme S subunit